MAIVRSGYSTRPPRQGSTRAYRKQRQLALTGATTCGICHQPFQPGDPIEADHIIARADNGTHDATNLRPVHRTCNRRRGRGTLRGGAPS